MAKKSIRNDPDTNNMREIGERLRLLRENYGKEHGGKVISIEKFGKDVLKIGDLSESGMTVSAINNLVGDLERGTQVVSPAILRKYSQVCHVSIDYIINGTNYTPEPTHARITLKDLCEQIVTLDKCRLIDLTTNDRGERGIVFRSADTIFHGRGDLGEYESNAPREYLLAMNKFLRQYDYARNVVIQNIDTPNANEASDLMVKGIIADIPSQSIEWYDPIELSATAILESYSNPIYYHPVP